MALVTVDLVAVQGAMALDRPAAEAWARFAADIQREHGVTLRITSPAGAYRSEAMVADMYLSSPARRKAVYGVPIGVGVAKPRSLGGSGSVHENGRCIDISNNAAVPRKSLVAIAADHGFAFTIPSESWHVQFQGGGSGGGFAPPKKEDDTMLLRFVHPTTGAIQADYAVTPGLAVRGLTNRYVFDFIAQGGGTVVTVPDVNNAFAIVGLLTGCPREALPKGDTEWINPAVREAGGGTPDVSSLARTLNAELLDDFAALKAAPSSPADLSVVLEAVARIPTAEQNGQAARDAIVKP